MLSPHYFFTAPVFWVAAAFLFNVITGVFGMNNMTRKRTITFLVIGLFLVIAAAWQSANQQKDSDANTIQNSKLINQNNELISYTKRMAAAFGIPLDQPVDVLADQTIRKQLAEESIKISNELMQLLSDEKTKESGDISKHDTQAMLIDFQNTMNEYNKAYAARALSLIGELKNEKIIGDDKMVNELFEHPTNLLGVEAIAQILGKAGYDIRRKDTSNVQGQSYNPAVTLEGFTIQGIGGGTAIGTGGNVGINVTGQSVNMENMGVKGVENGIETGNNSPVSATNTNIMATKHGIKTGDQSPVATSGVNIK